MDNMPYEVATALLLSGQKMTRQFKKNCQRARERAVEPVSRSTALSISAAKTGHQKLQRRLGKANAKQLLTWSRRTLARANRYQDQLNKEETAYLAEPTEILERAIEWLQKQIQAHDALGEAIQKELTSRATRGIGYRKPVFVRALAADKYFST